MSAVQLISTATEFDDAEEALRRTFSAGAEEIEKSLGYQGGQAEAVPVHWHEQLGVWGCIDGLPEVHDTRFWNAFGTEDPRAGSSLTIVCEVNPARDGVNPRVAGAFARDSETAHRLLLHRGRIGGGRAGIGQELFWANTSFPSVTNAEDPSQRFVVVADLDGVDVPRHVAAFVREVKRIKSLAGHPAKTTRTRNRVRDPAAATRP